VATGANGRSRPSSETTQKVALPVTRQGEGLQGCSHTMQSTTKTNENQISPTRDRIDTLNLCHKVHASVDIERTNSAKIRQSTIAAGRDSWQQKPARPIQLDIGILMTFDLLHDGYIPNR
jgi:hypothetical protein